MMPSFIKCNFLKVILPHRHWITNMSQKNHSWKIIYLVSTELTMKYSSNTLFYVDSHL